MLLAIPLYATSIEVGGIISTDTIWSADTLFVNEEVIVKKTATLSINPGVSIIFQGYFPLTIHGRLLAIGEENDSIVFSSDSTVKWAGIRFDSTNSSLDTSCLQYCHIRHAQGCDSLNPDWIYGGAVSIRSSHKIKLSHCNISNNSAQGEGGGICGRMSSVIINKCTFEKNRAHDQGGGAICCYKSLMKIDSCVLLGNSAFFGGGIYAQESQLVITNSNIQKNTTTGNNGGGLSASTCTLTVFATEIDSNQSTGIDGGGISIKGGKVILDSLVIADNSCSSSNVWGGGICVQSCQNFKMTRTTITRNRSFFGGGVHLRQISGTIENCIIESNSSDYSGGGINSYHASPIFKNCLIADNTADGSGGGIYTTSDLVIINSIFKNNVAANGGGIYLSGTNGTLVNCLFNNNKTYGNGGGVMVASGSPRIVNTTFFNNDANDSGSNVMFLYTNATFYNCIIWSIKEDDLAINPGTTTSTFPSFYNCDISSGLQGIKITGGLSFEGEYKDNISSNPLFKDTLHGDFSLNPNSPCINAGTLNSDTLELPGFDMNGQPRIVESRVDIGAFEFQGVTLSRFKQKETAHSPDFFLNDGHIRFKHPLQYESTFTVFDLNGRKFSTFTVPANSSAFPLEKGKSGLWIIQSVKTGKTRVTNISKKGIVQ